MVTINRIKNKEKEEENLRGHIFIIDGITYIFGQISTDEGVFISLENGNRFSEKRFPIITTAKWIIDTLCGCLEVEHIGICDVVLNQLD